MELLLINIQHIDMVKLILSNRATCLTRTVSGCLVDFLRYAEPYSHIIEASEPFTTKTNTTDRVTGRVHESASHAREKIAEQLQPGAYFERR